MSSAKKTISLLIALIMIFAACATSVYADQKIPEGESAAEKILKYISPDAAVSVSCDGKLKTSHSSNELKVRDKGVAYRIKLNKGTNDLRNFSVTYHDAVEIDGRKLDERLTFISAESDDEAVLRVSSIRPEYKIRGEEWVISEGDDIAGLAAELASQEPVIPYRLGGRSLEDGIDCAHFVGYVYGECGIDITSNGADANVRSLRTVLKDDIVMDYDEMGPVDMTQAKPGDIIIFFNGGSDSHTAIYLGDDMIAHAMDEEYGVTLTTLRYDSETGRAGYSGKVIQYVIRPYNEYTVRSKGNATVTVKTEIVDPATGRIVSREGLSYKATGIVDGEKWGFPDTDLTEEGFVDGKLTRVTNSKLDGTVTISRAAKKGDKEASVYIHSDDTENGTLTVATTMDIEKGAWFTHEFVLPKSMLNDIDQDESLADQDKFNL